MRLAVMQPYMFPYVGYFRLMKSVDAFVVFDDAQFVRRGWINRNRLLDRRGSVAWMTLPVVKAPQSTPIYEMRTSVYGPDWSKSVQGRFPAVAAMVAQRDEWGELLSSAGGSLTEFLLSSLRLCMSELDISTPIVRSTELAYERSMGATEKILSICETLGAGTYVNLPGGRLIYAPGDFANRKIGLEFLDHEKVFTLSVIEGLWGSKSSTSDFTRSWTQP